MPRTRADVLAERVRSTQLLGARLAAARLRAGLSQTEAARALRMPQSRLGKLELGLRQLQFLEGLRLATLYKIDPTELDPDLPEEPVRTA